MDYLTRLIAGAGTSPTKQRPNTPGERLTTCTRICNALYQLWRTSNVGPEDEAALKRASDLLERLRNVLHDESRNAAPHSCLLHVASNQVYIVIVKLALQSQDNNVIKAASQIFHILINAEAEGLLDSKLFARSLLDLVRYTVAVPRKIVDLPTESVLIELLFEISTKIRLDPDILPAWFYPERDRSQTRNAQPETRRNQFPLFYVLVQFVHHDGTTGDFARTGLLYLTETASKSKSLETWMIESDLAPQMASGLGALYSRLSRVLPALSEKERTLPIIACSEPMEYDGSNEGNSSHREDMRHFLSYLAFWQDTLSHCTSIEVRDTLLDHFQVLFVQQLLYPSLLESSDVYGGSTAAVMAHLARMLNAMENGPLAQRMLPYLVASKVSAPGQSGRLSMSRRKSLDHLAALAEAAQSPSPNLFNLLDLLVMCLRSRHVNTVNASLKLLSVILSKHHSSVLTSLFRITPPGDDFLNRSVNNFNKVLIDLFDLAAASATVDTMDDSYQATLNDTKVELDRHCCAYQNSKDDEAVQPAQMSIANDCRLLESLKTLFESFFGNDTLTNLLLTEVLMSLAACEHVDLYGWLLPSTGSSEPQEPPSSVIKTAATLVADIKSWRARIPDWNTLITRRREELVEEEQRTIVSAMVPVPGQSHAGQAESTRRSTSSHQRLSRPSTPTSIPVSGDFGSIDGTLTASPNRPSVSSSRPVAGSPLRKAYIAGHETGSSHDIRSISPQPLIPAATSLDTRISLLPAPDPAAPVSSQMFLATSRDERKASGNSAQTGVGSLDSGTIIPSAQDEGGLARTQVSLGHILTNAIVLQEFILEVAAVVQVRATLFAEVDLH